MDYRGEGVACLVLAALPPLFLGRTGKDRLLGLLAVVCAAVIAYPLQYVLDQVLVSRG
jgi:hypothetical protein